ncbi:MAG: GntR family transcriptional regulator [Proteobacteria bacterium]|nr:GntR family transcriptional regulator [Pseudomonadota bacterium]MBU1449551.1 GntR family transcriptional regulator [Pseudomonadota bacterium]MBU2467420.1 GntR family transcriptional regulator [Pseudomonadota bacterium]MBU2518120.1 GntR family transcriptional regulator [Pseudomonadota bacterium]
MAIEEAHSRIKNMIYLNQLAPGQKIIYSDLSKRLNTSVTPVIQALNRLEANGFVTYIPNKGYFVGEITQEEAMELYEAREALEIYIIPKIIQNITPPAIKDIKALFRKYNEEADGGPSRKIILVDAQFHLSLAEYSGNEVVNTMLREIFEKLYLKYRPEYLEAPQVREVAAEHRQILAALGRGDAQTAIATTSRHIAASKERITRALHYRQETGFYRQ